MRRAFSLIEVVLAVAIFGVSLVALLGLFSPVARSVTSSADGEAAGRVADALRTKLQSMPFDTVAKLLKVSTSSGHELVTIDARSDYDLTLDPQLVFASRDGSKVGVYNDPIWVDPVTKKNSDLGKYFEIALVRNEAISPKASTTTNDDGTSVTATPDDTAVLLAYTARLRWPAFISNGTGGTVQFGANSGTVRFDHGKKQVLYFTGAVTR